MTIQQMTNKQKKLALIGISLLSFTAFLDATIVSTALPAMQANLRLTVTQLQWVMNIFFLALSALMISMSKIADFFGKRRIFYLASVIFGLASLGAGFAINGLWLIFFRGLQGITCAATVPVGIVIVQNIFESKARTQAIGTFSAITGSGLALGPVVGGFLVAWLGWQAVFFVNVPIIIIGLLLCIPNLHEIHNPDKEAKLNIAGIILIVLSLAPLIFAIVELNRLAWHTWIIRSNLILSLLAILLFFFVEKKSAFPIIPKSLFKNQCFIPVLLYAFVGGGTMAIMLFACPLYLTIILNQSHIMTGVYLFIMSFMVTIGSPIISRVNERFSSKKIALTGIACYFISALLILQFSINLNYTLIIIAFTLFGLGWAIFNTITAIIFTERLPSLQLSSAMGSLYSVYNIGAALLLAFSVLLFNNRTLYYSLINFLQLHTKLNPKQLTILKQFVIDPSRLHSVAKQLPISLKHSVILLKNAFVAGMHNMYWPSLFFCVVAFIAVWTRIKEPRK